MAKTKISELTAALQAAEEELKEIEAEELKKSVSIDKEVVGTIEKRFNRRK